MIPAAVVDAFTDAPFAGNPAGLVLLDGVDHDPTWMQAVAAEFGLPETAFLVPRGAGVFGLQWFTPTVEVDLCGHATLASAHWLWQRGERVRSLRFETRSGLLTAVRDENQARIWLEFPVVPVVDERETRAWAQAFPGASRLRWIGRTTGARDIERNALVVTDARTLRGPSPDFARIAELPCGGVIVTARSDDADADVCSRYFAPAKGIDEDPVTGSAHCTVAWYWSSVLSATIMRARQLSPRGGDLLVTLKDGRVRLGGRAVTAAQVQLLV